MYRGSRLATTFLLFVTGLAALATALFVVPPAIESGGAWVLVPIALAYAIAHFVALGGVARGRDWGRNLAVFVAEIGGGIAILGGITLLVGVSPFSHDPAAGPGLVAWTTAVYALLGIAAGRVPVVARLSPLERRRAVLGPSFAGIAA
jgi:hypothetical protein